MKQTAIIEILDNIKEIDRILGYSLTPKRKKAMYNLRFFSSWRSLIKLHRELQEKRWHNVQSFNLNDIDRILSVRDPKDFSSSFCLIVSKNLPFREEILSSNYSKLSASKIVMLFKEELQNGLIRINDITEAIYIEQVEKLMCKLYAALSGQIFSRPSEKLAILKYLLELKSEQCINSMFFLCCCSVFNELKSLIQTDRIRTEHVAIYTLESMKLFQKTMRFSARDVITIIGKVYFANLQCSGVLQKFSSYEKKGVSDQGYLLLRLMLMLCNIKTNEIITIVNSNGLPESIKRQPFRTFLSQVPEGQLGRVSYGRLLQISRCSNNMITLRQNLNGYFNQLFNSNRRTINNRQNTHTASVHKSVSESIIKLKNKYKNQELKIAKAKIEELCNELDQTINNLQTSTLTITQDKTLNTVILRAASKMLTKINKEGRVPGQSLFYKDGLSKTTLFQVTVLCMAAINDGASIKGKFGDAKKQFILGLYESQRGYNIDENGIDNQEKIDRQICLPGIINKMIEKLWGLHPDCSVVYVTPELAGYKLPIVVDTVLCNYFANLPESQIKLDLKKIILQYGLGFFVKSSEEAMQDDEEDIFSTVPDIWNSIKPIIADRIFQEFKTLYKGKKDSRLTELIASGVWAPLCNFKKVYGKQ